MQFVEKDRRQVKISLLRRQMPKFKHCVLPYLPYSEGYLRVYNSNDKQYKQMPTLIDRQRCTHIKQAKTAQVTLTYTGHLLKLTKSNKDDHCAYGKLHVREVPEIVLELLIRQPKLQANKYQLKCSMWVTGALLAPMACRRWEIMLKV